VAGAALGRHTLAKLADRLKQHAGGRFGTSAGSSFCERGHQRLAELDHLGRRVSDPGWHAGNQKRRCGRDSLPRPAELSRHVSLRYLGWQVHSPAAVDVGVQASLLELVHVLGEHLGVVEDPCYLTGGHGRGLLGHRAHGYRGHQQAAHELQLVPFEHAPEGRSRPEAYWHHGQDG
jgi:hypothetical protein